VPGGLEVWLLLLVMAILFGLPRLQRGLERRVDEAKLGRETLKGLAERTTIEPLEDGAPVEILAEFARLVSLRVPRYSVQRSAEAGVNAIALPGGTVVVTAGLMNLYANGGMTTDELAGVLAHEVAHIELGHSRAREVRETMARWAQMAMPNASMGMLIKMAFGAFVGGLRKKASREAELAADAWAAALLRRSKYDDAGLASFLAKTAVISAGGGLWSTHPAAGDRIRALKERA